MNRRWRDERSFPLRKDKSDKGNKNTTHSFVDITASAITSHKIEISDLEFLSDQLIYILFVQI